MKGILLLACLVFLLQLASSRKNVLGRPVHLNQKNFHKYCPKRCRITHKPVLTGNTCPFGCFYLWWKGTDYCPLWCRSYKKVFECIRPKDKKPVNRPPRCLFDFPGLEKMILRNMGFKMMFAYYFHYSFKSLRSIDFSFNNIAGKILRKYFEIKANLPYVDKMDNLTSINLAYNKISSFQTATFFQVPNLRYLNMSHNLLSESEFKYKNWRKKKYCGPFQEKAELRILDLGYNKLETLYYPMLGCFQNLKTLVLDGNPIKSIDTTFLTPAPNLKNLYVQYIKNILILTRLDLQRTSVTSLYLAGTGVKCDCDWWKVIHMIGGYPDQVKQIMAARGPERYTQIRGVDVSSCDAAAYHAKCKGHKPITTKKPSTTTKLVTTTEKTTTTTKKTTTTQIPTTTKKATTTTKKPTTTTTKKTTTTAKPTTTTRKTTTPTTTTTTQKTTRTKKPTTTTEKPTTTTTAQPETVIEGETPEPETEEEATLYKQLVPPALVNGRVTFGDDPKSYAIHSVKGQHRIMQYALNIRSKIKKIEDQHRKNFYLRLFSTRMDQFLDHYIEQSREASKKELNRKEKEDHAWRSQIKSLKKKLKSEKKLIDKLNKEKKRQEKKIEDCGEDKLSAERKRKATERAAKRAAVKAKEKLRKMMMLFIIIAASVLFIVVIVLVVYRCTFGKDAEREADKWNCFRICCRGGSGDVEDNTKFEKMKKQSLKQGGEGDEELLIKSESAESLEETSPSQKSLQKSVEAIYMSPEPFRKTSSVASHGSQGSRKGSRASVSSMRSVGGGSGRGSRKSIPGSQQSSQEYLSESTKRKNRQHMICGCGSTCEKCAPVYEEMSISLKKAKGDRLRASMLKRQPKSEDGSRSSLKSTKEEVTKEVTEIVEEEVEEVEDAASGDSSEAAKSDTE